MRMMTKSILLSLSVILVMTISVLGVGTVIIDDILYRFQERVLRLELTNASQAIFQKLNRSGMRAATQAAADLQEHLRQAVNLKTVRLYVVEAPDNRVVYHPEFSGGDRFSYDFVDRMFSDRDGSMEYVFSGVSYYAAFTTIYPLKWLICVSITKGEMLERKIDFLWAVGGITFFVLGLNALVLSFFWRPLLRRIGMALDCVNRIKKGDLSARIPAVAVGDELGSLLEGINAMSARIQQRTVEQQEAEKALRESRKLLQSIIDNSTAIIFVKDRCGRYLLVNQRFEELFHIGREAVVGQTDFHLFPPERAEAFRAFDQRVLAAGNVLEDEELVPQDDGLHTYISIKYPLHDEAGQAFAVCGISTDITERKRTEAALRNSEEHLALAQEAAGVASWEWDIANGEVTWSDTFNRHFGFDATVKPSLEAFQRSVHPDDLPGLRETIDGVIATGRPFNAEYRIIRPDGSVRWLASLGRVYYAGEGQPVRMRGINLDVTERVATTAALRDAKEEAERASRAKSKFLAAASHDLRQPTQSLVLLTSLLKEQTTGTPLAKIVTPLDQATDALSLMLDSLLEVSRLDAGVVVPQVTDVVLPDLVGRLAHEYGLQAHERGLRLRVHCTRLMCVRTDPVLLERILRNLLENALRYTQAGGILLGVRRRREDWRIDVVDTGFGIAPEHREAIFEEFFQVDNPARDRTKGLGLGLAIVQRQTHLLGGRLSVDSRPGKGSRFSISLPLAPVRPPHAVRSEAQRDMSGRTILVLDDEPIVRLSLKMLLEDWGLKVVAVTSVNDALSAVQAAEAAPHAIVADYRLEGHMTGIDVVRAIHERCGRMIPALIMTGDTARERILEAHASGFGILHKPIKADELKVKVARLLCALTADADAPST
jgi:PAS domain S-box-containing protein